MVKYPTIRIAELRRIIDALLVHAEKTRGPELRLNHDYYWDISNPELYDTAKSPEVVKEVGSLGDDWEFLHNISQKDIESEGPYQMLIHVAPLLRYLADTPGA
jgi:hypothetical protein